MIMFRGGRQKCTCGIGKLAIHPNGIKPHVDAEESNNNKDECKYYEDRRTDKEPITRNVNKRH